jgi:hypothetical protein
MWVINVDQRIAIKDAADVFPLQAVDRIQNTDAICTSEMIQLEHG